MSASAAELIKQLCRELAAADERYDIAQDEGDEYLSFLGERWGRNFGLYGLMQETVAIDVALADFATIIWGVKSTAPEAFESIRPTVERWAEHFGSKKSEWLQLWKNNEPEENKE